MTDIQTIGVVGAGAMGRGIAQIAAQAGLRVRLYDTSADAIAAARESLRQTWEKLAQKGKLTAADAQASNQKGNETRNCPGKVLTASSTGVNISGTLRSSRRCTRSGYRLGPGSGPNRSAVADTAVDAPLDDPRLEYPLDRPGRESERASGRGEHLQTVGLRAEHRAPPPRRRAEPARGTAAVELDPDIVGDQTVGAITCRGPEWIAGRNITDGEDLWVTRSLELIGDVDKSGLVELVLG